MFTIYQTRIAPNGNCLQAVIASLLEMPLDAVPDFSLIQDLPNSASESPASTNLPEWYKQLQDFLRQFGLTFIEIKLVDKMPWFPVVHETLAIFNGSLASGSKHSIVGKLTGMEFIPVFDPLGKDELGFEAIESVCLLVPVDPMIVIKMGRALEEIMGTTRGISNRIIADAINGLASEALMHDKSAPVASNILGANGQRLFGENGKN